MEIGRGRSGMLDKTEVSSILQSFKINAECVNTHSQRHFAFYDLELGAGCKIARIKSCLSEIALKLKSRSIPFVDFLPLDGILRLQVIEKDPEVLPLDEMLKKEKMPDGVLPFLIGEYIDGNPAWMDMAKNPHLLVAGTTGSGKSTFLHNLIFNALATENVEIFLIDPKKIEFNAYEGRRKINAVVYSYEEACSVLENLLISMELKYNLLAKFKFDVASKSFPKTLVIVDEIADLILQDKKNRFETLLTKLAAKSRAAGIYFVVATQRPSVNVLTGLIKANFPARLSCKVSSRTDSQVILDELGAENLFGKGDALVKIPSMEMKRLQIAYVKNV